MVIFELFPDSGNLHQQGKFGFKRIVPAAEHIQGMSEVTCLATAVLVPVGIRV